MQKKKEQSSEELYGELGQAFCFTYGDLEANRAGFITSRQKRDLRLRFAEKLLTFGAATLIWIIVIGYLSIANPNSSRAVGALVMTPFFVALVVFLFIKAWRDLISDIHEGKVQRLEGIARELRQGRARRKAFVVDNSQLELKLNNTQYRLTDGRRFLIYIAPKSREIVAIEAMLPEES